MTSKKDQAIRAAVLGNWQEAVVINQELSKLDSRDTDCLNRLAFAYSILGRIKDANDTYQAVLKIDACNPIALKNLRKTANSKTSQQRKLPSYHIDNNLYLEEAGKTKVVNLLNTAPPKILKALRTGQPLLLAIKRLKIFILDENKQYLGMLPDNISQRLIKFLKGGNLYEACIKAVDNINVTIFIRETKRAKQFEHEPSFTFGETKQFTFHQRKHYAHSDKAQTESVEDEDTESE